MLVAIAVRSSLQKSFASTLVFMAVAVGCTDRATGDSATATLGPSTSSATTDGATTSGTGDTTGPAPTTGSTTAPTTTSGAPACEPYTFVPPLPVTPPHIMLVVDQSPAMLDPWDHDADPQTPERPRWASVRAALEAVLPLSAADGVALGLARYPGLTATDDHSAQACAVEPGEIIAPGQDAADALLAALPAGDATLVGAAPMRAALDGASELLDGIGGDRPRGIVLITHSAPNCAEAAPDLAGLLEGLDEAALGDGVFFELGMRVIAVGVEGGASPVLADMRPDGVDVLAYLEDIGFDGFANPGDEAALLDELTQLLTGQSDYSCTIALDPAPGPEHHVAEVRVAGQTVPGPLIDCGTFDGWHLVGAAEMELCGDSCSMFIETGDLEVDFACGA